MNQSGEWGEQLARQFLTRHGYVFCAAQWRCKVGEIDLIMDDGSTRVFIEVKLRQPTLYGEGIETVAWQKQKKLLKAAAFYQQKANYWGDIRFDVVSIIATAGQDPHIEHIKDAFTA